jgi:two-component system sensor histidine kinase DegS
MATEVNAERAPVPAVRAHGAAAKELTGAAKALAGAAKELAGPAKSDERPSSDRGEERQPVYRGEELQRPAGRGDERQRPDRGEERLGGLLDEAQAAVSASANVLRDVRERYRIAHRAEVNRWEALQAELRQATLRQATPEKPSKNGSSRATRERDEAVAAREVGAGRAAMERLDLALRSLENAWLFLDPTDETLVHDPSGPASAADAQMRIVEAQEAERNRLAREVHDGPAQALSNAIFQVEVVERLLDRDEQLAREELQALREMLARELRGVRAYLSQLRPPLLADLGLVGAIKEAADQVGSVLGVPVTVDVDDRLDALPETIEVVILRIVQEALQNVRKHAAPRSVSIRAAREGGGWVVEVRDDGRGFETDGRAPALGAPPRRRSFGLQFMRERAGLIGARFEVRSRPELGTVVRMVIPASTEDAR